MSKELLSEENAREQVDVMLEYYDVDADEFDSEDKRRDFNDTVNKLVKHVRKGRISISVEGSDILIKQKLQYSTGEGAEVTYSTLKAQHKVASDAAGEKKYSRIPALMGSVSGLGDKVIRGFKGVDMSAMECLAAVFFSV